MYFENFRNAVFLYFTEKWFSSIFPNCSSSLRLICRFWIAFQNNMYWFHLYILHKARFEFIKFFGKQDPSTSEKTDFPQFSKSNLLISLNVMYSFSFCIANRGMDFYIFLHRWRESFSSANCTSRLRLICTSLNAL